VVRAANNSDIEQGIRLTVGGATISGELISGKRYFEELAASIMKGPVTVGHPGERVEVDTAAADAFKSIIAESYKFWTRIYDKPEGAPDDYAPPPPKFIHLRKAIWIYPNGKVMPTGGVVWRGRLSAVDGFSIGRLGPT
jgi:hypothetical protein